MIKKFLLVFVVFFATTSLTLASEKAKLPDYKEWPVNKIDKTAHWYSTYENNCENLEGVERNERL